MCLQEIPGVVAFFSAKDIPGENSFMPVNAGVFGITENELIFLEIDSEVLFHGQPCGMIVAKTMAIANMAATHVEIVYQKLENDRPIVASIFHWREKNELSACKDTKTKVLPPNTYEKTKCLGEQKQIKGKKRLSEQTCNIHQLIHVIIIFLI